MIREDPDAAAAAVAAELNLDPAEAKEQMGALIFLSAQEQAGADYLGGKLGEDLFATAEFNQKLGQIPSVFDAAKYTEAVKPDYAAAATK